MKEYPILFSGPMVRAILDGRKTQTRRIIKPQPSNVPIGAYCDPYNKDYNSFTFWTKDNKMILTCGGDRKNTAHWRCPYGQPGDQLWVRETWGYTFECSMNVLFKRDYLYRITDGDHCLDKWHASIHMPREASRITLEITNIRAQRVQDISEADAQREGWDMSNLDLHQTYDPVTMNNARDWFKKLWDSINGTRKEYARDRVLLPEYMAPFHDDEICELKKGTYKISFDGGNSFNNGLYWPHWYDKTTDEWVGPCVGDDPEVIDLDSSAADIRLIDHKGRVVKFVEHYLETKKVIHGYCFADNPWVWVIEFKRVMDHA